MIVVGIRLFIWMDCFSSVELMETSWGVAAL